MNVSQKEIAPADPANWPPPPSGQSPTPEGRGWPLIPLVAAVLGAGIGAVADYLLQGLGFLALERLRLITLLDDFDGTYSHTGRQLGMDWGVFLALLVGFMLLRRRPGLSGFGTAGLVAHCLVGGLNTLLLTVGALIFG